MNTIRNSFDFPHFYADLDVVRQSLHITWQQVWRRTDTCVPPQLKARIEQQEPMSRNACQALAEWAGLDLARYVESEVRV